MLGTSHLPEVAFQVKIFQKILKFIFESSGKNLQQFHLKEVLKIEDSTEWSTDSKVRTTLHVFAILVIAFEPTGRYSVV